MQILISCTHNIIIIIYHNQFSAKYTNGYKIFNANATHSFFIVSSEIIVLLSQKSLICSCFIPHLLYTSVNSKYILNTYVFIINILNLSFAVIPIYIISSLQLRIINNLQYRQFVFCNRLIVYHTFNSCSNLSYISIHFSLNVKYVLFTLFSEYSHNKMIINDLL